MRTKVLAALFYSFPVQLFFHHVRRNLALVLLWLFLVVTIVGGVGRLYGIHYLYLDPEYLNEVGFWSFFVVGLAYGTFTMSFHITCYILDSHRFAFLGVLERPFAKFSINNSLIPLIVLGIYLVRVALFQLNNEYASLIDVVLAITGILSGIAVMLFVFSSYFKFTNKDIFKFLAGAVDKRLRRAKVSRGRVMNRLSETKASKYKVTSYLDLKLRRRTNAGLDNFYDKASILKVFDQNHFNSVILELFIVALILVFGFFMEYEFFQIPAAASALLLCSFGVMGIGAISYWFKGWSIAFAVVCFFLVNILFKWGFVGREYQLRGLDYDMRPVNYSLEKLDSLNTSDLRRSDSLHVIEILERWKAKQEDSLPTAVFVCVSGGGQRAALWSVNALQSIDQSLGSPLLDQTVLITGASGGMIGVAYFRELFWRSKQGISIPSNEQQRLAISQDNLNPIIFSLLVNDAFFRVRKLTYGKRSYLKDRGYMFEQSLNRNLNHVLEKPLIDYRLPEMEAHIPLLLLSPVIANDGRKLYISAQSTSYMNESSAVKSEHKMSGVDFGRLFEGMGTTEVSFLSALRMSASFPYVTPSVSLPSDPAIEIMDAGISDNFGIADATRFMSVFRTWFEENAKSLVIVAIRDTRKQSPVEHETDLSLIESFMNPISSIYNNFSNIQDLSNESRIRNLQDVLDIPLEVVAIEYDAYSNIQEDFLIASKEVERKQMERASLSWHLTSREKQNIMDNIDMKSNQEALVLLNSIIK